MIGFIGAGRVAGSFGKYLAEHGIAITGFYDLDQQKAEDAAILCSTRAFTSIRQLLLESPVIFISTNDDQIAPVARELAAAGECGQTVIGHFSGVYNSQLLRDILPENYYCFSLHPLQSFSGSADDKKNLAGTFFTLEGQKEALDTLKRITKQLPNTVVMIEPEQKVLYHAAGVMASNYITTVIAESLAYFEAIGIKNEQAAGMLHPLVFGTVNNAFAMGPEKSLTGPVARGDYHTLERHLEVLRQSHPDKERLYRELGVAALALASKELLTDKEKIEKIETLFKGDA